MTVVVGIRGHKGVLLAADSQATIVGWGDKRDRQNGKTHLLTETIGIAICGSPRISQVLRFMDTPALPIGADPYKWAVKVFIPAVRTTLKDAGCLTTDSGVDHFYGGFLLAVRDRLFEIAGDLQVGECQYPWAVDGSGGEAAAGHFHAQLADQEEPVSDEKLLSLARSAIASADALNAYCGGRTVHVKTKKYTAAERKLAKEVLS